jgi:glutamate-1-semialdehyde 2,1-aminomutase
MNRTSRKTAHSSAIMDASRRVFPGGVNSPVRSFSSVGGTPVVFEKGQGKHLTDVDGNTYIDFCASWGPLILGYGNPAVVRAVKAQIDKAMTFGAPSAGELVLAEKVMEWVPGLEMIRFVSSGTEAAMSAIRVARAATGRSKILKFIGCYHGHADCLLIDAGSGLATLGQPSSAGVTAGSVADTLTVHYNDKAAVEHAFDQYGADIALIAVEPLAANMGLVLPQEGFLAFLREITTRHGALLLFDEVMTGFRIARGGAAERYGVEPDLWAFGKIIGGGLPAAAYGGKRAVMECVAPLGKAYQAGTLSGNPVAMAAGLATLEEMDRTQALSHIEHTGALLDEIVERELASAVDAGLVTYVREASFFCFFFGQSKAPLNFADVSQSDFARFSQVYHAWLDRGVYLGPSGYEVGFLNALHDQSDIERLVGVVKDTLA